MASKSILQIDVQDEKFKAFAAAFEKYKASVKDLPKGWAASGAAISKIGNDTDKAFKNVLKTNKDLNKSFDDGHQKLKNIAKTSGEISANFASTALSVAKWVTLGGLASGFGLGALASAAAGTSKQARGIGVTTGELRAADTNYGKYLGDPGSTLSKIADVQSDLFRRQILKRLGGNEGEDAAQQLPALFKNAVAQFKAGGQTEQYANTMGLTQVFDIQDLRRGAQASAKQLDDLAISFRKDIDLLSVSENDSDAMTNFWIQIKRSGEQLETGFIKALIPLTPQLTQLSTVVTKAITDFVGSKEVREAMENFTKYLGSDEVKNDLHDFFTAIKEIAKFIMGIVNFFSGKGFAGGAFKALRDALNPVGAVKDSAIGKTVRDWLGGSDSETKGVSATETHSGHIGGVDDNSTLVRPGGNAISERFNNPGNLRSWGNTPVEDTHTKSGKFAHFATVEDGLKAMAKQLRKYQDKYNLHTVAEIVARWSPSNENDTAGSIKAIADRAGFKANEKIDLHDSSTLSKLIYAMTKQENPRSNYTPSAVNHVLISNAAGSDLVVTSNGLK